MRDIAHTDAVNTATPLTRAEQKERTRIALLDAALRLLEHRSFGSLCLREVTREAGGVPTAFPRQFASREELVLALIDASFGPLRGRIGEGRSEPLAYDNAIRQSAQI